LDHLVGGLCDIGFRLLRFAEREQSDPQAEPGSESHMASYLPPFIAMFSQRPQRKS
jgi:hypothetical protein